jgi:integrase
MGTVYRKTYTKPVPAGAEVFKQTVKANGKRRRLRFARWKDSKGETRTARVTVPAKGKHAGQDRLIVESPYYVAKYRDGNGHVREVATGCRSESGARSILTELERRAERVKSNLVTTAEDAITDHHSRPIADHFADYLTHLRANRGVSAVHLADTDRLANRVFAECSFAKLSDIGRDAMERWLAARLDDGLAARTRNSYLQAVRGFCNWCVQAGRLLTNPLAKLSKADEKADRRRQRRSLTEAELTRLLEVARQRPLAEFGRLAIRKEAGAIKGTRDTWKAVPLSFDDLPAATARARERLKGNPAFVERLERLGRERSLIYKALVLTGLRRGELASLTMGQLHLDRPAAFATLDAADEKNREGSTIAIRSDLADDLDGGSKSGWNACSAMPEARTGNVVCR